MGLVFGVSMVKNEEDIILATVLNMLNQIDYVIVADNMSTDNTREILDSIDNERLVVIDDLDPAYYQSRKMTALAMMAKEKGADWIVPFDADEFWYSSFGPIREILNEVQENIAVVSAKLYDHVPTAIDDESDTNPVTRIGYRRVAPGPLPKVACRAKDGLIIEQGNHDATYNNIKVERVEGSLVVRHYPYRTAKQMAQKAITGNTALSYTDLPEASGKHWRDYASLIRATGEPRLAEVFTHFFWSDNPTADLELTYDPAPSS